MIDIFHSGKVGNNILFISRKSLKRLFFIIILSGFNAQFCYFTKSFVNKKILPLKLKL